MFMVLLTGEGEGCDYTIACNKAWVKLKATTIDEAEIEVGRLCDANRQPRIKTAEILEVVALHDFDTAKWETERKVRLDAAAALKAKEKRREMLKQLQEEFRDEVLPGS